jgi:catechol 2,3-dioxygenase-like lactoylglutathione lyase family enzyme
MKRTWTIIGVRDVPRSFKWYQSLLGLPETAPVHDYFGQVLDSDGTVLLCLHEWGAHEHPSLMSPDHAPPGNGLSCSSVSMISTSRYRGHARSSLGSKKSRTSTRTREPWSSLSAILTATT